MLCFLALTPALPRLQEPRAPSRFDVSDVMIPMRDGVAAAHQDLHAARTRPGRCRSSSSARRTASRASAGNFNAYFKALADDGYIFVFQDIRGKFKSEGDVRDAAAGRARRATPSRIDEGTDTYDTIDWLLKNVPQQQRPRRHARHLVRRLDDDHGRARAASGAEGDLAAGLARRHVARRRLPSQRRVPSELRLRIRRDDGERQGRAAVRLRSLRHLRLVSRASGRSRNVNAKYLHGKIPTWNDFVAHPDYDEFWKRQTMIPHLTSVKVPTLNVAGWWDQEDFYGPVTIYDALEKHDTQGINYLVVGPWNHGGWTRGTGDALGAIPFGSDTAEYFREQVQAPFFAYFLKDKGTRDFPQALTFEAGSERVAALGRSGRRRSDRDARRCTSAPNEHARRSDRRRRSRRPARSTSYVSDPAHPGAVSAAADPADVLPGRIEVVDVARRGSALRRRSRRRARAGRRAPLDADVTIAGDIVAHLFASTTGSDADWIVKLIDVYPENYPDELGPGRLSVDGRRTRCSAAAIATSFEKPAPIEPDKVLEYTWSLHTQNYTFKKGHRIMVQVQSTWFPIIDRNPQTFVPNIFEAKESDFKAATHRVYRSAQYPSRVDVPVVVRQ